MSSSDIALRVDGLSKAYAISHQQLRRPTFRDLVMERVRHPFRRTERETFWALKDVSFEVRRGEVLGIIGRNGAGKSTLLKILSRITEPTAGRVELYGRVGSLLEVGTGFHPELTGRENVFLNGAILGMTRAEIRKQFDAIVDFAEVEKFLDTPVKHYSSGMYVRLAFAVAAHLNPEILVVDEVLTVGDVEFQKRCLGKMDEVAHAGRTVLFVSHNMAAHQAICSTGIVLHLGKPLCRGSIAHCIEGYVRPVNREPHHIMEYARQHSEDVLVQSLRVNDAESADVNLLSGDSEISVAVDLEIVRPSRVDLEGWLCDASGALIGQFSPTRQSGRIDCRDPGKWTLWTSIQLPHLNHGTYTLCLFVDEPTVRCYWEFPYAIRVAVPGCPMANGSVLETSTSGAICLQSTTIWHRTGSGHE